MKTASVLLPLLLAFASSAAAQAYKAVDVTLQQGAGEFTVGLSTKVTPTLGVKNPTVRNGVAYVAASHSVGEWNVALSPRLPLSLNVQQGTGSLTLNLSGLPVTALNVNAGMGEVTLNAPARTLTTQLKQSVGSLAVYLPANTGLQLNITRFETGTLTVEGQEVASGQNLTGSYQTANFATARNKITLNLTKNAGEVTIYGPGQK